MPLVRPNPTTRVIIFDLDDVLLVRDGAWRYALEEAVASVTGRRIDARPLASEYMRRPWRHALSVVVNEPVEIERAAALCETMFVRSAMKRLLIHDGLGMALDRLRAARIEMGAISRARHEVAIKQIESTGLERFLTVLSATPEGERWDVTSRIAQCLAFVERSGGEAAFVSADEFDLRRCSEEIGRYEAGWAMPEPAGFSRLDGTADLDQFLARR